MFRKKFTPRLHVIRDQEGKILQSEEEITERRTICCDNLYKAHGGGDNMVKDSKRITSTSIEEQQDILYSKVEEAICSLKKERKSTTRQKHSRNATETGGKQLTREIHKLCNKVWQESTIPKDWSKSIPTPISRGSSK